MLDSLVCQGFLQHAVVGVCVYVGRLVLLYPRLHAPRMALLSTAVVLGSKPTGQQSGLTH
jgi:hypothetical protein